MGGDTSYIDEMRGFGARWQQNFDALIDRISIFFARRDTRSNVRRYLQGLLAPVERKNTWQIAEHVGDPTPTAMQYLLDRARWDAHHLRDDLQKYVIEHLGDPDGVAILDETGFLKKGMHSVGVQRQYSGTAGRIENCQIGVFLAYATQRGRTFLDRSLYIPSIWLENKKRCKSAGIPDDVEFATKPQLGIQMLSRAFDVGVPIRWVTGDEVYGNDHKLRHFLVKHQRSYVLAVARTHQIHIGFSSHQLCDLAAEIPASQWHTLSAGNGSKGPRNYKWSVIKTQYEAPDGFMHCVLFRQSLSESRELAYYVVFAQSNTSIEEIVQVAGKRWCVEECFQSAKGEVGLDQYEVRSWHGWYRHITFSMWMHAFLTVQRAKAIDKKKRQLQ